MQNWSLSFTGLRSETFSPEKHRLISVDSILANPDAVVGEASLQKFAKITPQYPGIRSELCHTASRALLTQLTPMLDQEFGSPDNGWEMQAWFSLVTAHPSQLLPMQRFPHVDGTDPNQLAMMLYLDRAGHGGTGFYRHRTTGFEALTAQDYPRYKSALENDVRSTGLPPAAYAQDGAPHFERIHKSEGAFNEAVFYRGNILHSGLINEQKPLSPDPAKGRLTINAFFRPKPQ